MVTWRAVLCCVAFMRPSHVQAAIHLETASRNLRKANPFPSSASDIAAMHAIEAFHQQQKRLSSQRSGGVGRYAPAGQATSHRSTTSPDSTSQYGPAWCRCSAQVPLSALRGWPSSGLSRMLGELHPSQPCADSFDTKCQTHPCFPALPFSDDFGAGPY